MKVVLELSTENASKDWDVLNYRFQVPDKDSTKRMIAADSRRGSNSGIQVDFLISLVCLTGVFSWLSNSVLRLSLGQRDVIYSKQGVLGCIVKFCIFLSLS